MIELVLAGLVAVAYLSILGVPIGLFVGYFVFWQFRLNRIPDLPVRTIVFGQMVVGAGWLIFPLALGLYNSPSLVVLARGIGVLLAWALYAGAIGAGLELRRWRRGLRGRRLRR